jgi:primary-amine oxidase
MPRNEKNPWGNAWTVQSTLLETEQQAQRMIDPFASRSWKIVNPRSTNRMGEPVGYKIMPMENAIPYLHDDSYAGQRARFAFKHLWVTKYEDGELFAAGDYPWQSPGGEGLPKYIAADDDIVDTDIVVWYTMGHTHVARLEDWPLMPNAKLSFWMKPVGFFDGNPAADLPKPAPSACHDPACHSPGG